MQNMIDAIKKQYGQNTEILKENEEFTFSCVACGDCCKNRVGPMSIIIYPYDTFNLMKGLNIDFQTLFTKHLTYSIGRNSGIPIIYLENRQSALSHDKLCTFLKRDGKGYKCSVHDFKPVVCSMYPLGRISSAKEESLELNYLNVGGCNNKNKKDTNIHTIESWVKNRKETEEAFKIFSSTIVRLNKVLNTQAFMNSDTIPVRAKDTLMHTSISFFYDRYDTSKDFIDQFKDNMDTLEKVYQVLAHVNYKYDSKIVKNKKELISQEDVFDMLGQLLREGKMSI
ncbi:MAG: YkgJ family cysteine cluster protein [Peptostreptococcaceae bacterium]